MNEKPCDTCHSEELRCKGACEEWRKWARAEWRRVTKQVWDVIEKTEEKNAEN